jgi:hypothetical protein
MATRDVNSDSTVATETCWALGSLIDENGENDKNDTSIIIISNLSFFIENIGIFIAFPMLSRTLGGHWQSGNHPIPPNKWKKGVATNRVSIVFSQIQNLFCQFCHFFDSRFFGFLVWEDQKKKQKGRRKDAFRPKKSNPEKAGKTRKAGKSGTSRRNLFIRV